MTRQVMPPADPPETAPPAVSGAAAVSQDRNLESRTWGAVLDLHGAIFARLNRAIGAEFGITLAKFDVLAQLVACGEGLNQGALSQRLKVTGGNVTGLVRRLEGDGLVTRHVAHDDRRANIVLVTANGRDLYLAARARHDELLAQWLGSADAADLARTAEMLRALTRAVTAEPGEAAA